MGAGDQVTHSGEGSKVELVLEVNLQDNQQKGNDIEHNFGYTFAFSQGRSRTSPSSVIAPLAMG